MSRKARLLSELAVEDNATPKIWLANRGYSEYKADIKTGRTRDAVVILYHKSYLTGAAADQHPLLVLGGILGRLLSQTESMSIKNIVSIDISSLVPAEKYEEWLDEEGASVNLEKRISKPVCRVLEKMLLLKSIIVSFGAVCQLLLKVISPTAVANDAGHRLTAENISRMIFINPLLPTRCINAQFRGTPSAFAAIVIADVIFSSDSDRDRRLPVIRSFFPKGESFVRPSNDFQYSLFSALSTEKVAGDQPAEGNSMVTSISDLDATNTMGETIWMSEVTILMNKNSKQYEQSTLDLTRDMRDTFIANRKKMGKIRAVSSTIEAGVEAVVVSTATAADDIGGDWIGGLVLRGNRCVLVRSLQQEWAGMRVPSVRAVTGETPQQTAERAVTELCDIDADEFYILSAIQPQTIYQTSCGASVSAMRNVTVFLMYAVEPPPEGALEDQDKEDPEDLYDWYTWERAVETFNAVNDYSSVLAMRCIACVLSSASFCSADNILPRKWGGVFGQEWIQGLAFKGPQIGAGTGKSESGEIVRSLKPLPILILVGGFGSGKTTLLQNILLNQGSCKQVAVVVNTIAGVNFDGSTIQQSGGECCAFKVFEINNCCVCCSMAQEVLLEVQRIADSGEFDYCIIEASGAADLSILTGILSVEGKKNVKNTFVVDNTVAVVDAASCLAAMAEKMKATGSTKIVGDINTILYGQIRTAEVIVINKCDVVQSSSNSPADKKLYDDRMSTIKFGIRQLNSFAAIIETSHGDVEPSVLMHTHRAQLRRTVQSSVQGVTLPESGLSSWTFRSFTPFHPTRLHEFMSEIGQRQVCAMSDVHVSSESAHRSLLRINGYTWLANYPDNQGLLSYTRGHSYEIKLGAPWWATIDRAEWPSGLAAAIQPLWREPYGDRQVELVCIGFFNDLESRKSIESRLNRCLLTDLEYKVGQAAWNEMDDPFSFSY
jgi:G3E family GTPase/ADP-ribose pyrophosphatase YjhB (NUDIX family)